MKIMNVTNLDVDWFGASVFPAQKKTNPIKPKKKAYPVATSTDGDTHHSGPGFGLNDLPIISDAKGEEIGHFTT